MLGSLCHACLCHSRSEVNNGDVCMLSAGMGPNSTPILPLVNCWSDSALPTFAVSLMWTAARLCNCFGQMARLAYHRCPDLARVFVISAWNQPSWCCFLEAILLHWTCLPTSGPGNVLCWLLGSFGQESTASSRPIPIQSQRFTHALFCISDTCTELEMHSFLFQGVRTAVSV